VSLTDTEHRALTLTAELADLFLDITGDGPSRSGDIREAREAIHVIQRMIMAQSAARAHPDLYRVLGAWPEDNRPRLP
jgi:hypothetical protein